MKDLAKGCQVEEESCGQLASINACQKSSLQKMFPFMPIQTPSSQPIATSSLRSRVPAHERSRSQRQEPPDCLRPSLISNRAVPVADLRKGTEHVICPANGAFSPGREEPAAGIAEPDL